MEYFFYCRDKPGTAELRMELLEAHWSFMDDYAEGMIARGPTLAGDGVTATGSLHIVDLPDAEAARVFAFEEPNYKAGVYAEVMVRRWRNLLGRTMWQYGGGEQDDRFLVIAHGAPGVGVGVDWTAHEYADRLIVCGPLLSEDGSAWVGDTFALDLARGAVEDLLAPQAGLYEHVEIHRWIFGGRR